MAFRWVILPVVLCGCASQYKPPTLKESAREPTTVDAPFDRTWNAVIDQFAATNTPVQTLDKSSGFIVADRLAIPATKEALALADCGTIQLGRDPVTRYTPSSARYNVVVRTAGTGTTVRVTAKYLVLRTDGQLECVSTGLFEGTFETAVKVRAEKP